MYGGRQICTGSRDREAVVGVGVSSIKLNAPSRQVVVVAVSKLTFISSLR